MAHRRRVMRGRKGLAALGLVAVTIVLAAVVHVTNEVTLLRRHLVTLEAQRRTAEAERAELLAAWNVESSLPEIRERAAAELGLVVATDPGITLIATRESSPPQAERPRRFLRGLSATATAQAAEPRGVPDEEPMVSLAPIRHGVEERP